MTPHSYDEPWQVELYPIGSDEGPVLDFVRKQTPDGQTRIVRALERLEEFGVPFLRQQGQVQKVQGISETVYEIKLRGSRGHSYRLFVCVVERRIIIVHIVTKKAMKLRREDVRTAEQRARRVREYLAERGKS